ncbi:MAG: adenylyl-sulfate kinase [Elusimicrobia bacterium]|nr:adenylyl-sulfate kinase [Elusimicrobiota bacterium]
MAVEKGRESLRVVMAGHVDHGKTSLVGRLLADTLSLPKGKLEQVKAFCERNARPFEYAFLIDALKDEQSQGITIDVARIFFKTTARDYLLLDAPGHVEFLKSMVSGAAHASAALLVVDAEEGVRENTQRHGTMLSMLGIRHVAVVVNKMDRVSFREDRFLAISEEISAFLRRLGLEPASVIPISAREGSNITARSELLPWYDGPTVLEALDRFPAEPPLEKLPLRLPVQDVYRFTALGDQRRIIAGTIASGILRLGDEVVFYPSGKSSRVATIEGFPKPPVGAARAGAAVGFTLREQVYVRRGELAVKRGQTPPQTSSRLRASVFWLGKAPLEPGRDYVLKLGTARVPARVESVQRVIDTSTLRVLEGRGRVERHEAAECVLAMSAAIAFDRAEDNVLTGRFVIVDGTEIRGGGLVLESLPDAGSRQRERVILRNIKWQKGLVPREQREARFAQKAALVMVSGRDDGLRKAAARALEEELYRQGRLVYFLGIGSLLYGVGADIRGTAENHEEDFRRFSEVAHILMDSGMILVSTAAELSQADWDIVCNAVEPDRAVAVWVGQKGGREESTNLKPDLLVCAQDKAGVVAQVVALLRAKGILSA